MAVLFPVPCGVIVTGSTWVNLSQWISVLCFSLTRWVEVLEVVWAVLLWGNTRLCVVPAQPAIPRLVAHGTGCPARREQKKAQCHYRLWDTLSKTMCFTQWYLRERAQTDKRAITKASWYFHWNLQCSLIMLYSVEWEGFIFNTKCNLHLF